MHEIKPYGNSRAADFSYAILLRHLKLESNYHEHKN